MSQNPPLAELAAQLQVEEAPDPRALLQSNASKHHDRAIGAFFDAPSPEALALLLARAKDSSPVLHPGLGGRPVLGGYGKATGTITVADKVAFAVKRLLGNWAEEALKEGPAWVKRHQGRLHVDAQGKALVVQ